MLGQATKQPTRNLCCGYMDAGTYTCMSLWTQTSLHTLLNTETSAQGSQHKSHKQDLKTISLLLSPQYSKVFSFNLTPSVHASPQEQLFSSAAQS